MLLPRRSTLAPTVAALLLWCGSALAEADPQLQALIDQRQGQLTEDGQRQKDLQALDREQRDLGQQVGKISAEGVQAANNFDAVKQEFLESANQLVEQIDALSGAGADADALQQIEQSADGLLEVLRQLSDAATQAVKAGAADSFDVNINLSSFISQSQFIIVRGASISFAEDSLRRDGDLEDFEIKTLGTVEQRLENLKNDVEELVADGNAVAEQIPVDEIRRFEELREREAQRREELAEIEFRANEKGSGAGVLDAFLDRTNGEVETALSNDAEAGERLQELAEGLAGAGQRLAEIDQELDEINAEINATNEEFDAINAELSAAQDLLSDPAELEERLRGLEEVEQQIRGIAQNGEPSAQVLQQIEDQLAALQEAKDGVRNALDQIANNQIDRDAVQDRIDELSRRRNELGSESGSRFARLQELNLERDNIAALQAELEFLIRNGAPLGDPQQTSLTANDLDSFLNGGGNDSEGPGRVITTAEEIRDFFDQLSQNDPLALGQFGFDADQGRTQNIVGGLNGGLNLIPCPAGSNALPVGTLVSDTAACFL
ncbi:MAG: hypothetical protein ACMVY4_06510 [Minwuia sp.]|uniref:hypothetical protein n=1 Tax=Minwuia sp. TaxID=2493630 RepID=UPI003A875AFC